MGIHMRFYEEDLENVQDEGDHALAIRHVMENKFFPSKWMDFKSSMMVVDMSIMSKIAEENPKALDNLDKQMAT